MSPIEAIEAAARTRDPHGTAKTFYGTLSAEGFTPEQIIALASALLGLVAADIVQVPIIASK